MGTERKRSMKDDRVRRLAGGAPHMDVALSTEVGRRLGAVVHHCYHYAIQAVLDGLAEVYVEGVHYNPVGTYPDFMPNGSIHAWCITKDKRLVDPTVNGYTMPGWEEWLAAYQFTPLAVLTRSEIRRAWEQGGREAVRALVRSLSYTVPPGVAPMTDEAEVTEEAMQRAMAAQHQGN
jgi:hypothetical protein